jgi:hypothetical protein
MRATFKPKTMIKIGIGLIIIFIAFISCSSCDSFIEEDDELTLPRENYIGNQLKINGIYYSEIPNSTMISRCVLYNNGPCSRLLARLGLKQQAAR